MNMKQTLILSASLTLLSACSNGDFEKLEILGDDTIECGEKKTYQLFVTMDDVATTTRLVEAHIDEDDVPDDILQNIIIVTVTPPTDRGIEDFDLECTKVGCYLAGKDSASDPESSYDVHGEVDLSGWFSDVVSDNKVITCVAATEEESPQ